MKQKLFLCHRHEESELANGLKETLARIFSDAVKVIPVSEKSPFVGEDRWLNKLDMAIKDCTLILALCDKDSAANPWINFTSGSGWMAGKRVIVLRYGGTQTSQLPQPLTSFQSYDITKPDDFRNFVKLISFTTCFDASDFDPAHIVTSLPAAGSRSGAPAPATAPSPARSALSEPPNALQYINALRANYEFDRRSGIHRSNAGLCVCTACLLEGIESPLTEFEVGWQCSRKGCEKFYSNPDYPSVASEGLDYDPFTH